MSDLLQNYNGGTTDEYGTFLTIGRQMGSGVVEGLLVVANATPNMTVYVQPGSGAILTGTYPSSYNYNFATDTALPGRAVTVGTAAASPRIDYIVAYVDKTVSGSTAGANVNNTNSVIKYADVQGTPAGSPSVPTVSQIQSTIGASNPYMILAQIAVGASVSTITNSNITDLRSFAADRNDTALGVQTYVDNGGVASYTASTLNGNISSGLAYINVSGVMVPQSFSALSLTMAASKDRYYYVQLGNTTIQAAADVATGGTPPTLPMNAVWIAKYVSGASAITGITNLISPKSRIGYATSGAINTIIPGGTYTTYTTVTGVSHGLAVEITGMAAIQDGNSGGSRSGHVRVQCDGVSLDDIAWVTAISGQYMPVHYLTSHTPSAGIHTWTFQVEADTASATAIRMVNMSVREIV